MLLSFIALLLFLWVQVTICNLIRLFQIHLQLKVIIIHHSNSYEIETHTL